MIKAIRIRLYPTKKQEELMFKSASIARFYYNWGSSKNLDSEEIFEEIVVLLRCYNMKLYSKIKEIISEEEHLLV